MIELVSLIIFVFLCTKYKLYFSLEIKVFLISETGEKQTVNIFNSFGNNSTTNIIPKNILENYENILEQIENILIFIANEPKINEPFRRFNNGKYLVIDETRHTFMENRTTEIFKILLKS